jgi:hypothetical protein
MSMTVMLQYHQAVAPVYNQPTTPLPAKQSPLKQETRSPRMTGLIGFFFVNNSLLFSAKLFMI